MEEKQGIGKTNGHPVTAEKEFPVRMLSFSVKRIRHSESAGAQVKTQRKWPVFGIRTEHITTGNLGQVRHQGIAPDLMLNCLGEGGSKDFMGQDNPRKQLGQ